MAKLFRIQPPQTTGEARLAEYLQRRLPDDWYIVTNVVIQHGRADREIDALVIGENIWVISEKGYRGVIEGDEYAWILPGGRVEPDVVGQVLFAAKLVKGKIVDRVPTLRGIWVEGVVVLSAEDAVLAIDDARVGTRILRMQETINHLTGGNRRPASQRLEPHDREQVLRALVGSILVDRWIFPPAPDHGRGTVESSYQQPSDSCYLLRLDGPDGFRRVYYEDCILGRAELRGLRSLGGSQFGSSAALQVHFAEDGVYLTRPGNSPMITLQNSPLLTGASVYVPPGTRRLAIDGINLSVTVVTIQTQDLR